MKNEFLWNRTRYTLTSSAVATRPSTGLSPAWPDLDVDLEIESLQHPERYPLIIKRNAKSQVEVGYRGQNTVKFVQNEKVLSFGNTQINLIFLSLIRTFAGSLIFKPKSVVRLIWVYGFLGCCNTILTISIRRNRGKGTGKQGTRRHVTGSETASC